MDVMGKSTINPLVFYTGKIAGYVTWGILFPSMCGYDIIHQHRFFFNQPLSVMLLVIGVTIAAISLINLGRSTRFGLPVDETKLKTGGLYKYSRNPMYLGFNLMTLAAMGYTLNLGVVVLGIYSLMTYHFIILGEEKFMLNRFGEAYSKYKTQVRRYI